MASLLLYCTVRSHSTKKVGEYIISGYMGSKIYISSFLYGATGAQNIYDSTFSGEHTPIDRGIKYINTKVGFLSDFYPTSETFR
jgi:hypothetical protein